MNPARSFVTLALLATAPLCACAGSTMSSSDDGTGTAPPTRPLVEAGAQATAFDVEASTRKAWLADAQWTELYVLSAIDGLPDATQASGMIAQTRGQIVSELAALIGEDQAAELGPLLQARDDAAIAYVDASRSANGQKMLTAVNALYASTDAVAQFMANAKMVMTYADAQEKLHDEANALVTAIDARVAGDFQSATTSFNLANHDALLFAESLSSGVTTAYANALGPTLVPATEQVVRLSLRTALDDQAFWTRVYAVEHMAQDETQPALDQASQDALDASKVFQASFGITAGNTVQFHVHAQLADAVAYVFARDTGDATTVAGIRAQWNADGDAFAQYLATLDPDVSFADVDGMLHVHVDRSISEIEARAMQQWDADATDYGNVVDNLDALSDELAVAIQKDVPPTGQPISTNHP